MAFLVLLGGACSTANGHDASDAAPASEVVHVPYVKPGEGACEGDFYNGHGGMICLYDRCPYSCCIDAGVVGTCYYAPGSECSAMPQYVCEAAAPVDAGPDVRPDVASPH